jgi:hypothetical protein
MTPLMARSHIDSPPWLLPELFAGPLQTVQEAVDELKRSVGIPHLEFTLDGRFVGDLGEAIAAHYFDVALNPGQAKGHDATLTIDGEESDVEVKIRRNSTQIWFDSEPTHLLIFRFEPCDRRVTLVYAGPGDVIRTKIRNGEGKSTKLAVLAVDGRSYTERQTISLNQLAEHFDYEAFMRHPSIPFRNRPELAADH